MSERLLAQATLHNVFNCPWAEDRVTEDNFYSFCFWLLSLSITDRGMIQSMTSYWSSSSWVFPELRIQKLGFGWFKSLGNHHSYSRCQKYENVLCLVTLCSPLPLLSLSLCACSLQDLCTFVFMAVHNIRRICSKDFISNSLILTFWSFCLCNAHSHTAAGHTAAFNSLWFFYSRLWSCSNTLSFWQFHESLYSIENHQWLVSDWWSKI